MDMTNTTTHFSDEETKALTWLKLAKGQVAIK